MLLTTVVKALFSRLVKWRATNAYTDFESNMKTRNRKIANALPESAKVATGTFLMSKNSYKKVSSINLDGSQKLANPSNQLSRFASFIKTKFSKKFGNQIG